MSGLVGNSRRHILSCRGSIIIVKPHCSNFTIITAVWFFQVTEFFSALSHTFDSLVMYEPSCINKLY